MRFGVLSGCTCAILVAMSSAPASAGWTYVDLGGSKGYGASSRQQVGRTYVGAPGAALWSGTADSWVSLHPAGTISSEAYGVSGGQQVGYAEVVVQPYPIGDYQYHAALWSGTAASWIDLNPAGSFKSYAYGVSDGKQVGVAYINNARAGLWSGTAASWVSLHPAGATTSEAHGISASSQVGYATIGGQSHAGLWNGTAASWVDLNPGTQYHSYGYGVSGNQQVGATYVNGVDHASLWNGAAASWVDLNPAGGYRSQARAVCAGVQAGWVDACAGIWRGTAQSWVDLDALLPPSQYGGSWAYGVYVSGAEIWVVGYANTVLSSTRAILWHYVPEPSPLLVLLCGISGLCAARRRDR